MREMIIETTIRTIRDETGDHTTSWLYEVRSDQEGRRIDLAEVGASAKISMEEFRAIMDYHTEIIDKLNPSSKIWQLSKGSVVGWGNDYVAVKNWDGRWETNYPDSGNGGWSDTELVERVGDSGVKVLRAERPE